MTRRALAATCALVALATAGCGGSGSGDPLAEELSFMPKDALIVGTVATDPDGGQWKQASDLTAKFPFAGQGRERVKQAFNQGSGLDFDKDVKPLLGNDAVFAVPRFENQEAPDPFLFALKTDDEGKAADFAKKDGSKISTVDGTDVYREGSGAFVAAKDGVLVFGSTLDELKSALARHDGDDHMTTDELDARVAGLTGDALVKVGVDVQGVLAQNPNPDARRARKIRWVGALRNVGVSVVAQEDGIELDFKTTSSGGLTEKDLPLAAGADAAPIVRRGTEIGFGLRDLTQVIQFSQGAAAAVDPAGFRDYERKKARAGRPYGIDFDRDVFSQFNGDASVSVGIDGSYAARSELRDPAAFKRMLRRTLPKVPKVTRQRTQVKVPKSPDGFYEVTGASGRRYVLAVVGGKFVVASDQARAAQFAGQSASAVPGAKGALTMAADTRALANAAAQRAGQGAAGLFTGALGDFVGSVDSETSGLTGRFKLEIK